MQRTGFMQPPCAPLKIFAPDENIFSAFSLCPLFPLCLKGYSDMLRT